jgi:hypothetical protein
MRILGYVLIGLNLIAAAAFAYFALNDWKVRKELTQAAFVRDIQLYGLPVEADKPPEGMDKENTPWRRDVNDVPYESIPKKVVDAGVGKGDDKLGGPPVYSQTEEVQRVQKKVFENIPAIGAGAQPHFDWLRAYLVAIARTGAERDGYSAVFDMRDPGRKDAARHDLPLAARTDSQTAALRCLIAVADLGDPQAIPETFRATRIKQARDAVSRFVMGEVPHGAADEEGRRKLTNALLSAMQDRAGEAQKSEVQQAATSGKPGWDQIGAVAIEPLADKPSTDRAAAALVGFAQAQTPIKSEQSALAHIGGLIRGALPNVPPPQGFNLDAEADGAATDLLNARFEDAAQPAGNKSGGSPDPLQEKARKIAHLLYHIDGWRYADATATAARKAWHERVASVVGLPNYVRAAESQATEYAEAAQRLVASITEEQSAFEAAYQAQLQRVNFLFSQYQVLDQQLKAQQAITEQNKQLMDQRKTERDTLLKDLAQAREDAKTALANLQKTQKDLFTIEKQLRNAQEALFVLHDQLRKLEAEAQKDQTAGK